MEWKILVGHWTTKLGIQTAAVTKFVFCSHTTARGWPWGRGCLPSLIARQNISLLATAHDCETGSDTQLGSVGGMRMDIQLWHKHTLEPD